MNFGGGNPSPEAKRDQDARVDRVRSALPAGVPNSPAALEGLALMVDPAARMLANQEWTARMIATLPAGVGRQENMTMTETERLDQQTRIPVGRWMVEAQRTSAAASAQLARDVASLEATNARIAANNERIGSVLRAATGEAIPPEPKPWRTWYVDQLGFKYKITATEPAPTVIENVPLEYRPAPIPVEVTQVASAEISFARHSCFGKGTPVRTLAGPRPIETIKVGDLVLTQDTIGGKLGYRPVVMVHHNPPSPTFQVDLGGAPVVTSPSHRFWVAGRGWVMARDLKVGDPVRTLGGVSRVAKIEEGSVQPVFNLDVEGDSDFFVGGAAALVHDNTLPDLKQAPFDAPPAVAAK